MSRKRRSRASGTGGGAAGAGGPAAAGVGGGGDMVPVPRVLMDWVARQFGPALEAEKAWYRNPQPEVIVLPRTTQFMAERERIRRSVAFGRPKPPDTISFDALRAIARHSLVNSAIHARRRQQVRSVARRWDGRRNRPGWAIVHKMHFQPHFDATKVDGLQERIRRVEQLFERPHPEYESGLAALAVKLVEDHLTLDRLVINTLRSTASRTDTPVPYPTVQFAHVDGASLWPADLYLDRFCRLNGIVTNGGQPHYDQGLRQLREYNGVDLRDVRYVQVDRTQGAESPVAFLAAEDVRVHVANPSPALEHWGFGLAPAESSYDAANLLLYGISYVATFFRDAFSEMIGILAGAAYQDQDAQTIANILRTHHAGIGNWHRTPVLRIDGQPGDLTFQPTRHASARDMEFSETIHRASMWIHAHYGIHPSETFTDPNGPGGPSKLQDRNRDQELELARDEGFIGILDMIAEEVLTPLVEEWDPDLMFVWLGLDEQSEQALLEMRQKRAQTWLTLNEARKEENLPPLGPWADNPAPQAQAAFQAEVQRQQMEHQMELQQQMGQQPGGDGDDGDEEQGQAAGPPDRRPPHLQWAEHGQDDTDGGRDGGAAGGGGRRGGPARPGAQADKAAAFIEFIVEGAGDDGPTPS